MKGFPKIAGQIAIVAAGVIAGGFIMSMFKDIPLIDQARGGFDTGFL